MKLSDYKPSEVDRLLHRRPCMRKGTRTYRIFPSANARTQLPEKELAKRSPDEPVVTQASLFNKRALIPLGNTAEYKQAIKKHPPVNKKPEKKAEGLMSWMGDSPKKATRKKVTKASDEQELPDGLQKLFTTFNSDSPERPRTSGVMEASNTQGTSKEQPESRKGYEVVSHIQELAKKQGIENAYQLWQKIGGSKESAAQLWRGDFKKVGVSTLKKLCETLGCGVGDLLVFEAGTVFRTNSK